MSKMRDSEYFEQNDAYVGAEKMSGMSQEEFHFLVMECVQKNVEFPQIRRVEIGSAAIDGKWRRWTNRQDPIQSTYKGKVEYLGSAKELLKELGL